MVFVQKPVLKPTVVNLAGGSTGGEIQKALDSLPPNGGEVVLAAGIFEAARPMVLPRNNQTLRGAGEAAVLLLADGANCPVIILGQPLNHPRHMVSDNVISNAVLTANSLGIFMRASRNNRFLDVSIRDSREYGVFMAQAEARTAQGWGPVPRTECADNLFNNLMATRCGEAAFHVNNASCTNNIITCARFTNNCQNDLSLAAGLGHGSGNQLFTVRRRLY
jgi:hypothetical protein